MILTRYRHALPADYDMGRIRDRVAARGPLWDDAPDLVFKVFTIEDRAHGAAANAYASLYLWRDASAAADFLAGPAFAGVIKTFGRPRTDVWLPFAISPGAAAEARSLTIMERNLAPATDLAAERRAEAEQGAALAAEPDVRAVVSGLDPAGWRLVRFVLRADGPVPGAPEIAHLAAPGIAALRTWPVA
jgi:hypothetical protein